MGLVPGSREKVSKPKYNYVYYFCPEILNFPFILKIYHFSKSIIDFLKINYLFFLIDYSNFLNQLFDF